MKISTKGRYALRMLVDLADHRGEGYIALKTIAERQDISKKYLEQIVPILTRSDILLTNRGFQGGYMLGKDHQMFWRAGAGLDIKNGDNSSIIVSGGYQFLNNSGYGFIYFHAGILIEM